MFASSFVVCTDVDEDTATCTLGRRAPTRPVTRAAAAAAAAAGTVLTVHPEKVIASSLGRVVASA